MMTLFQLYEEHLSKIIYLKNKSVLLVCMLKKNLECYVLVCMSTCGR